MAGEHIRTRKGGRWTHAIDCGDATVIHLEQNGDGASRVLRTYRPRFVAGAEAVEVVTHRERTFAAQEIVARAYSRISLAPVAAMFRDSEAFAEWCATGRLPQGSPNVAVAVSSAAAARAAPAPAAKAEARSAAKPARRAAKAKAPATKMKARAKARASPGRKAARKRVARKASPPARKKAARRGAKQRRGRS